MTSILRKCNTIHPKGIWPAQCGTVCTLPFGILSRCSLFQFLTIHFVVVWAFLLILLTVVKCTALTFLLKSNVLWPSQILFFRIHFVLNDLADRRHLQICVRHELFYKSRWGGISLLPVVCIFPPPPSIETPTSLARGFRVGWGTSWRRAYP